MTSSATTPEEYINSLPDDRKAAMQQLRESILKYIDKDYEERMTYGMIGYVVPHSIFPAGYHCDPKLPLGYMSISSQKNFIAVYHMGVYGSKELLDWFTTEYPKHTKAKLDMGKSCIRFKKPEQIPFDLIGQLAGKLSVKKWVECYERALNAQRGKTPSVPKKKPSDFAGILTNKEGEKFDKHIQKMRREWDI